MRWGFHPANLFFRFFLEVSILIAAFSWGLHQADGIKGVVLAFFTTLGIAVVWGVFAVPGDRSRSGKTVVATTGRQRLLLELVIFLFGGWMMSQLYQTTLAASFAAASIVHYALSADRLEWLWRN